MSMATPSALSTSTLRDSDPHFLEQHLERLGDACRRQVVALHDRTVHTHTAIDVIGLRGHHLVQRIGGTVGLEGHTSISPKRWPPNWALPPNGCCVSSSNGRWNARASSSSTRWWSFSMTCSPRRSASDTVRRYGRRTASPCRCRRRACCRRGRSASWKAGP